MGSARHVTGINAITPGGAGKLPGAEKKTWRLFPVLLEQATDHPISRVHSLFQTVPGFLERAVRCGEAQQIAGASDELSAKTE